ncbi:hypothetical protein F383_35669 [Gossypium arboreum]|uniref:Uncharacterized protein n=1 Tax=Gossypium arboreum TaxID=29729 RepID=A0A0B0PS96_GOSAR|nr:hypothetical protein F383_35669 [Gossypium arboreum]
MDQSAFLEQFPTSLPMCPFSSSSRVYL